MIKSERLDPVTLILLSGTIVRCIIAVLRLDMIWPDEHFQTLEPAGYALFGFGIMSWEWQEGYRSWFLPGLYIPVLYLSNFFGIHGGYYLIAICRIFTALTNSSVLFALNFIMKMLKIKSVARALVLAIFAFSPAMILWSAATLGDNWAMTAAWLCLVYIIRIRSTLKDLPWIFAGFFCGLALMVKYQMAFWLLGLGLSLFIIRIPFKLLFYFSATSLFPLFIFGLLDKLWLGEFFKSFIFQASKGANIAVRYGTSPWWDYFPRIYKDQGWVIYLLAFLVLLGLSFKRKDNQQKIKLYWKELLILTLPNLTFLIFHIFISHKETRFILPTLPLIYILSGFIFSPMISEKIINNLFHHRKLLKISSVFLVILFSFVSFKIALDKKLPFSNSNISDLENEIYERKKAQSNDNQNSCIMLLNTNIFNTRGELILGKKEEIITMKYESLQNKDIELCQFAIVPSSHESEFQNLAGSNWISIKHSKNNWILFEKNKEM